MKQFRIAISGKAKSGKDTFAKLLVNNFEIQNKEVIKTFSFAEPLKKTAEIIIPSIDINNLYGESSLREEIISNKWNISHRDFLTKLGKFLREINDDAFVDAMDFKLNQNNSQLFIITDLRFTNEFVWSKKNNFITIRIKRNNSLKLDHKSETDQDNISDNLFDFIIENNKDLYNLDNEAKKIANSLTIK